MKKNSSIFIIMLMLAGMFCGIRTTSADVTVQDGSALTINSATLDMNCTDILVAGGGTLNLGSGVVDELGEMTVDPGGELIGGGAEIKPCLVEGLGTVVVDPEPNEINAAWTLECADGYTNDGTGDQTLTDVPVGDCTLTWGAMSGYASPDPNPANQPLDDSKVLTFSGSYALDGKRSSGSGGSCFINAMGNR